jgi:hypothetical protein
MVRELQFAVQTYFFDKIGKITPMHNVKKLCRAEYSNKLTIACICGGGVMQNIGDDGGEQV